MLVGWRFNQRKYCLCLISLLKVYGSVAVATMTTSGASTGRQMWYMKCCPAGQDKCQNISWDRDTWGNSKDEVIAKFKEHLRFAHNFRGDNYVGVVQSLCDMLEVESFFDTAADAVPPPPMPASVSTPKQHANPRAVVKNEPAQNASSSSKKRKVETPDKAPALKSDGGGTVPIKHELVLQINAADEQIQLAVENTATWNAATRQYVETMEDAIRTLEDSRDAMNKLLNTNLE